jgi:hypothetical protein
VSGAQGDRDVRPSRRRLEGAERRGHPQAGRVGYGSAGERVKDDRLQDTDAVVFYLGRHGLNLGDFDEVAEEQ